MNTPFAITENISCIAEADFGTFIGGFAKTYAAEAHLVVVVAEHKIGLQRSNFDGITDALEYAELHPDQNVLLLSFMPLKALLEKEHFALFAQLPNAYFSRLPITSLALEKVEGAEHAKETASKAVAGMIRMLNHQLERYIGNSEQTTAQILARCRNEVKRVQLRFPELQGLDGQVFITELNKLSTMLPHFPVMPGKEIAGVYCDVEGTLLVDGILQEAVLQQLHDYASQGSDVTIWTLGNVAEFEPLIRNAGILYPVKSKMDYSGAIAEIVIDNDSEETFRAKTQITPRKFIQV